MNACNVLVEDFRAVKERDPAIPGGIRGFFEIVLCTPGFQVVAAHRLIHFLHSRLRIPVLPRFLGLIVRWCEPRHESPMSSNKFGSEMRERQIPGVVKDKSRNGVVYSGIGLKPDSLIPDMDCAVDS